ncbi:hypothetical protein ACET3Z_017890 [Daucus carota]
MFPSDPRHYSRKRKLFQVGNTSTDPFGLNADALNNFKNTLDRPVKSFTSLLLDGVYDDDEDEDEYSEEDKKKELRKGQVMPFDRKLKMHATKNDEGDALWSTAIIKAAEEAEEKEARIQKLMRDLYEKRKELVSCQLENIVLEKKTKMAVKKIKSLRRNLREVLSRPGEGPEDEGESSFVGTRRNEAAWLCCKVCDRQTADMIICPCKHLSVCRRCDDTITKCPICKAAKLSSVQVCLP